MQVPMPWYPKSPRQVSACLILKRGTSQERFSWRCACVQSPKSSNGDEIGASCSTMRFNVNAPKIEGRKLF
jgi:hypothetical protein